MSNIPESFFSIKSKMNRNVKFAVEQMNLALEAICNDPTMGAKDKLKATQDFLSMYLRLENEIMKEAEHKETIKNRKLTNKIKQHEVLELEEDSVDKGFKPVNQSKFSPTMN